MAELKQGTGIEVGPQRAINPSLHALFEHWLSKCHERPMPARSDLVVFEIKEHLGWMSLLDVLPDGDFRYRLIGTRVTVYFSADPTGKTVSEAFAMVPEARDIMLALGSSP